MATSTKPYRTRASELKPAWHVLDAQDKILGRLSSEIAVLLQGKHKPIYVPHLNTGDYVIVINADKFRVTGNKLEQKMYYRHSGYPGGLKEQTLARLLKKAPTSAIRRAVKGMLPKNAMGRRMISRLKLYAGDTHPHQAQVVASQKLAGAEAATTDPSQEPQVEGRVEPQRRPPTSESRRQVPVAWRRKATAGTAASEASQPMEETATANVKEQADTAASATSQDTPPTAGRKAGTRTSPSEKGRRTGVVRRRKAQTKETTPEPIQGSEES